MDSNYAAAKMENTEPVSTSHNHMPTHIAPQAFGAPSFVASAPFNPYMVPVSNPLVQSTSPPQTAPRVFNPTTYQAMPMTGLAFSNPALPPTPDAAMPSYSSPMTGFSTQTQLPQLGFSPNTTMSPQLISPHSAFGSQLSDLSPSTNSSWAYSPAFFTSSTPSQAAPLPQTTPPTGAGMGFVNGYPYPTAAVRPALRVIARKSPRGIGADSPHSPRRPEDEDEEELVDIDEAQQRGGGSLGFTPSVTEANERIAIPPRREEVRNARIESEQRRRNELREGFERLRDVLPPSNQRVSKALLLDRGVAHIQSLDAANRYLSVELEGAKKEADDLRRMNHQLAQTLAQHAQRTSTATPVQ
ncbi:hypothetical protein Q8F55_000648 [Vanrija albida]|uniref:BHLH domain-containing protein n=1 Tax=Vanrija albida TaxID=181172 RepID=A0ABR3QDW1_9TREE